MLYSARENVVYFQVTGMSSELKEEFHNFRRTIPITPVTKTSLVEGVDSTGHYCNGFFDQSVVGKIVEWLKEKGAELKEGETG